MTTDSTTAAAEAAAQAAKDMIADGHEPGATGDGFLAVAISISTKLYGRQVTARNLYALAMDLSPPETAIN